MNNNQNNNNNNKFPDFSNFMKSFKSPKEAVMNMISKSDNPIISNMVNLANSNNNDELVKVARNLCKERGIDFDKDFQKFMSMFK